MSEQAALLRHPTTCTRVWTASLRYRFLMWVLTVAAPMETAAISLVDIALRDQPPAHVGLALGQGRLGVVAGHLAGLGTAELLEQQAREQRRDRGAALLTCSMAASSSSLLQPLST